jgi:hypothetical protein
MSRTDASVVQDAHVARIEPRGLSRSAAAAYVGVGTTLFDQLVAARKMPRPFRLEGRVLWDRYRLDAAIDGMQDDLTPADCVWDDVG